MGRTRRVAVWFLLLVVFALATGGPRSSHVTALASSAAPDTPLAQTSPRNTCLYGSSDLGQAEAIIRDFLEQNWSPEKRYRVQGWRWHTMSLIRDAKRLSSLASRLSQNPVGQDESTLEKAAYHVVEFNMKALHRIENQLFFPWLRSKLAETATDETVAKAFSVVLDQIVADQKASEQIGGAVMDHCAIASKPSIADDDRQKAIRQVEENANDLSSRISAILKREDEFLVPAVTVLVPDSEQRSFNSRVIRNLGVLDSRLHLVGMYEAVQEQDEKEQQMFQEDIPAIPRYMIPRWKRNLYDPQAGFLDVNR